jgi:hypothetical protein
LHTNQISQDFGRKLIVWSYLIFLYTTISSKNIFIPLESLLQISVITKTDFTYIFFRLLSARVFGCLTWVLGFGFVYVFLWEGCSSFLVGFEGFVGFVGVLGSRFVRVLFYTSHVYKGILHFLIKNFLLIKKKRKKKKTK